MLKFLQDESPRTTWMFPGQGSQDVGMGEQLLSIFPRATEILATAEQIACLPLRKLMARGPLDALARTEVVQPAIVALSCGYVDFLRSKGEVPAVVAGHSLGELSALYAAEVLGLNDVLRLAATRGRLMADGPPGGMVIVQNLALPDVERVLNQLDEGTVCVANLNAPNQLVVSGDDPGLENFSRVLREWSHAMERKHVRSQRLNVSGAWHSPLVAVANYEFSKHLQSTKFATPTVPIAMSSEAKVVESAGELKSIICRQMTLPVRWYETIEMLVGQGVNQFWEVGCGRVLKGLMRRILSLRDPYQVESLESRLFLKRLMALKTSPKMEGT